MTSEPPAYVRQMSLLDRTKVEGKELLALLSGDNQTSLQEMTCLLPETQLFLLPLCLSTSPRLRTFSEVDGS